MIDANDLGRMVEGMVGPIPIGARVEVRIAISPPVDATDELPSWAKDRTTLPVAAIKVRTGEWTMAQMRRASPQDCVFYYVGKDATTTAEEG